MLTVSGRNTDKHFQIIFWIEFDIMTAMILQNTISSFNLFLIESFNSRVCYFGELKKNLLIVAARNREENLQSFLSNWLLHYDCNNSAKNISRFNFFELKVLIAECVTLESRENKCVECFRNIEEHFQSYLLNWIWHYDYNDYVNTVSRFKLFWIESFDSYLCYFGDQRKKKLLIVAARNREEHLQSYLSNWLWHYDCNDSAKYNFNI